MRIFVLMMPGVSSVGMHVSTFTGGTGTMLFHLLLLCPASFPTHPLSMIHHARGRQMFLHCWLVDGHCCRQQEPDSETARKRSQELCVNSNEKGQVYEIRQIADACWNAFLSISTLRISLKYFSVKMDFIKMAGVYSSFSKVTDDGIRGISTNSD